VALPWRRLPSDIRAIAAGEHVLAWAQALDGRFVVGTSDALHLGDDLRIAWERVATASWADGSLEVVASLAPGEPMTRFVADFDEPGRIPEVVHDRVTSTIVVQRRVAADGIASGMIVARRPPGSTDVRWTMVFDPGYDPNDPVVAQWADALVEQMRIETGV
jgi:hypothetical protein